MSVAAEAPAPFAREHGALLRPLHLYSWKEISGDRDLPPAVPGVYAWYFLKPPPGVSGRGCHRISRRSLLYVGISPSASGHKSTVRDRIRYHFGGNASGSTLRTTLGCLLQEELGMRLRRTRNSGFRFTSEGETRLRDWMSKYARVCWVDHPAPWEVEESLINTLSLPLNLAGNGEHPFHRTLSEIRRHSRERARRLPPLRSSRRRSGR